MQPHQPIEDFYVMYFLLPENILCSEMSQNPQNSIKKPKKKKNEFLLVNNDQ